MHIVNMQPLKFGVYLYQDKDKAINKATTKTKKYIAAITTTTKMKGRYLYEER